MRADEMENVIALTRHVLSRKGDLSSYRLATCISSISSIARTLHKLDEASCNGDIDDEVYEKRVSGYRKSLDTITEELGSCFVIQHQRDPRGNSIKIWADKVDGRIVAYFT